MPYLPAMYNQLGHGTPVPGATQGSRDCGPSAVRMGIDRLTQGEVVPAIPDLRRRMGTPGAQQTNVYDARDGVESYHPKGRRPLRYAIRDRISDVKAAVAGGRYVQCCIDYGRWNALMARTGDPNFTGGHSVGVYGQRERRGEVWWLLWDPLEDARREGIPQGPRWVPRAKLVEAMEAFAGSAGRCYAGTFSGGGKR